ncbi:MAG: NAD(P)-dependent oxidoreductase [Chloroflexi bacterium]|nr:NAD(P)-dependent oxidoreductase [Chloroflexota bacterium]
MIEGLRDRRITLVGGAGFIGHHLALSLRAAGANVTIVDSLQVNNLGEFSASLPDFHNRELYLRIINERLDLLRAAGVPIVTQDARDYHALTRILTELKPQTIVHLAAVSHAGKSNKDPYSTFDHSLRTLENALDAARGHVEHFVFLSSSMAYGNFRSDTVTEDHPLDPIGIYGALKVAGEKMVIAYQQVFGLSYTIVRPSALYGPRCVSRRVGQVFIESAIDGSPLRIDGGGDERVDFTYIDDLVQGISLAITHPAARNEVFNLTYGAARSIKDLAGIIRTHFPEVELQYVERDRLVPFRGTLSVEKARELIGYEPAFPIERGFPIYIEWYRKLLGTSSAAALAR